MKVPSAEVGHLKKEMRARVKVDAWDYQEYGTLPGKVCFIAEDSEVQDGRTFHVVKIELEEDTVGRGRARAGQVRLGMSGQGEIVTERGSLFALLVKRLRQTFTLG
jgi:HlyD family secretion protein